MLRTFFRDTYIDVLPVGMILIYAIYKNGLGPWKIFGLCIAIVSIALWVLARVQLGDSFAIAPEARQLVTTGLYSKIRHPIYVFSTLAITSVVAMLDQPILFIFPVGIAIMQMIRAHYENKVLAQKFAVAFETYRRETWF